MGPTRDSEPQSMYSMMIFTLPPQISMPFCSTTLIIKWSIWFIQLRCTFIHRRCLMHHLVSIGLFCGDNFLEEVIDHRSITYFYSQIFVCFFIIIECDNARGALSKLPQALQTRCAVALYILLPNHTYCLQIRNYIQNIHWYSRSLV